MNSCFSTLITLTLMWALPATMVTTAQEKQKPGTTIDSWLQALPPEAEAQAEEAAAVAALLPANDETQKTLLALELRWMDSVKAGDADSLSQIVSRDFTFASPRAIRVSDRIQYLEYALRDLKLSSYEFENTRVRVFGRTAIVSSLLKQKAMVKGEDWGGSYLVTDVWLNREGSWRVVSRHESLVPEQK